MTILTVCLFFATILGLNPRWRSECIISVNIQVAFGGIYGEMLRSLISLSLFFTLNNQSNKAIYLASVDLMVVFLM